MKKYFSPIIASVGILILGACGNTSSTESNNTGSPTPSVSASSTSQSPSNSPRASSETPSPSQPTEASSAPASPDPTGQKTVAEPAAPGTNCGNPQATAEIAIYVSGGPVNCDEALTVFDEYNAVDKSTTQGVYGKAEVKGYECFTNTSVRASAESRAGFCINHSNGGYLEARPADVRIIPGPVEELTNFTSPHGGPKGVDIATFYPAGSDGKMGSTSNCAIYNGRVQCSVLKDDGLTTVILGQSGSPTVNHMADTPQAPGPEHIGGQPLDVGTTLTGEGVSCQPQAVDSVRCINKTSGFTISKDGVVTE